MLGQIGVQVPKFQDRKVDATAGRQPEAQVCKLTAHLGVIALPPCLLVRCGALMPLLVGWDFLVLSLLLSPAFYSS